MLGARATDIDKVWWVSVINRRVWVRVLACSLFKFRFPAKLCSKPDEEATTTEDGGKMEDAAKTHCIKVRARGSYKRKESCTA